jgi:hypothetical protein
MNTKVLFFSVMLLIGFTTGNAQNKQSPKESPQSKSQKLSSVLNGAWRSQDGKGFTVIHDGFFNSVNQDSTGKWNDVDAGSCIVGNDNTVTLKTLYSSHPEHIGSAHTLDYTIRGDILKLKFFKKLIDAQGNDITDQEPKDAWAIMIRVKK